MATLKPEQKSADTPKTAVVKTREQRIEDAKKLLSLSNKLMLLQEDIKQLNAAPASARVHITINGREYVVSDEIARQIVIITRQDIADYLNATITEMDSL